MNFNMIPLIILLLSMVIDVPAVAKEYNAGSISFNIDNDGLLGTDRGYTNGIFFKFNSGSVVDIENLLPMAIKKVAKFLPLNQTTDKGWIVTFGQQIWTPNNISSEIELENERPFAGLLFVKASIYESSNNLASKYSLMLGTVGPNAFAEQSQKAIHNLISSKTPIGWERQIENKGVFNISYETQVLLSRAEISKDKSFDASLAGRVNVGNFQNEIALGGTVRWGSALKGSFGSVGFTPGNYFDASVLSKSKSGQFYYLALEGRYRFNDITIDGKRPNNLFSVDTKHWQSTLSSGFVYYQESYGIVLSVIANSPEYEEDIHSHNATASLEIFWRG